MRSVPWKSAVVCVVAVLGAASMTGHAALARGMAGGAHFVGGGFGGHRFTLGARIPARRFVVSHGFVRGFRRHFVSGGVWPSYDYFAPNSQYGDMDTTTFPGAGDLAPEPRPVPICRRSEEIVRVPAEGGGTRDIKVTNCPYGW